MNLAVATCIVGESHFRKKEERKEREKEGKKDGGKKERKREKEKGFLMLVHSRDEKKRV